MRRFIVVQDGAGNWGILDLAALGVGEGVRAFAGYDFTPGTSHKWIGVIYENALSLNLRRMDRADFSWEPYIPRADR